MKTDVARKDDLSAKIAVFSSDFELLASVRNAAIEKASRLLHYNARIDGVRIELERIQTINTDRAEFVAKGLVEFGGPAVLSSVMSDDPTKAIDYLIEQLDRLLRRRYAPWKPKSEKRT